MPCCASLAVGPLAGNPRKTVYLCGGSIFSYYTGNFFYTKRLSLVLAVPGETFHLWLINGSLFIARISIVMMLFARERRARDLHDTLAQGTAATILQLEASVELLKQDKTEQGLSVLESCMEQARASLKEEEACGKKSKC